MKKIFVTSLILAVFVFSSCTKKKATQSQTEDALTGVRRTSLWPFSDSNLVRSVLWSATWDVKLPKNETRRLQCWYIRDFQDLTAPDFSKEKDLFCHHDTRLLTSTAVDTNDFVKKISQSKTWRLIGAWALSVSATTATLTACGLALASTPETVGASLVLAKGLCALVPAVVASAGNLAEWDPSWGAKPVAEYARMTNYVENKPSAFFTLNDNAMGYLVNEIPKVPTTGIGCKEALQFDKCHQP